MKNRKVTLNIRMIFLYLFIVLVSVFIIVKIIYIQEVNHSFSDINTPKFFEVEAPRGNIFADDGSLLAISMPLYNIYLDLSVIDSELFNQQVISLSQHLANLFSDRSYKEYEFFLREARIKENNKYVLLRKKVTYNELKQLKQFPIFKLGKNRGGLIPEQRENRAKPFGILAKRTIGILREDNPVGIERAFDEILTGKNGIQLKQKTGNNLWMPKSSSRNRLPVPGNDIQMTIDIDIQDIVEYSLREALISNDADWGCVAVMEVSTGEIKAIANLKRYSDTLIDEYYNYVIGEHSEPGSTFKLASIIAGLEDGYFDVTDSVDTKNGKYKFYDKTMLDSKPGGYGKITIADAFVVSSNVGISKTIYKHYKQDPSQFLNRIYKMGLTVPLELELPYANNLLMKVPESKNWSGVSLPWMSIGYEMRLTPLHILTFYNAVANDGKMVSPIFTSSIISGGKILQRRRASIINSSICSKSTIKKVIPLLARVVNDGTAQNIKTNQYSIAGKTGTTLLNYGEGKNQESRSYQASFAGFFPSNKPRYSCIVVINNPKSGNFYGSTVAAPVFREISDKIYAFDTKIYRNSNNIEHISSSLPIIKQGYTSNTKIVLEKLGIDAEVTEHDWMIPSNRNNMLVLQKRRIKRDLENGIIPDLSGLGIQDALYLLENHGLQVKYDGYGSVKKQSISKGVRFKKGELIKLLLS